MSETEKKGETHSSNDAVHPTASLDGIETGEIKGTSTRELDEAAKYLAGHDEFGPLTPEMEKKLLKKIDAWILPLVSSLIVVTASECMLKRASLTEVHVRRSSRPRWLPLIRSNSAPPRFTVCAPTTTWSARNTAGLEVSCP